MYATVLTLPDGNPPRTSDLTLHQIGVYHHVTGVDASSSASLAAYINTLTYKEHGQQQSAKIVEGVYWYDSTWSSDACASFELIVMRRQLLQCLLQTRYACPCHYPGNRRELLCR